MEASTSRQEEQMNMTSDQAAKQKLNILTLATVSHRPVIRIVISMSLSLNSKGIAGLTVKE